MKRIKLTLALSVIGIGSAICQESSKPVIFNDDCWNNLRSTASYSVDNTKGELRYLENVDSKNNYTSKITFIDDNIYRYTLVNDKGYTISDGTLMLTDENGKTINRENWISPDPTDLSYQELHEETLTCKQVIKKGTWTEFDTQTKKTTYEMF